MAVSATDRFYSPVSVAYLKSARETAGLWRTGWCARDIGKVSGKRLFSFQGTLKERFYLFSYGFQRIADSGNGDIFPFGNLRICQAVKEHEKSSLMHLWQTFKLSEQDFVFFSLNQDGFRRIFISEKSPFLICKLVQRYLMSAFIPVPTLLLHRLQKHIL